MVSPMQTGRDAECDRVWIRIRGIERVPEVPLGYPGEGNMKTQNKHTHGPWKYLVTHPLSGDAWFVIADKDGRGPIMDVGGKDKSGQIAEAKYLITDPQEIESNARLIAAAPEMLEACEAAFNWLNVYGEHSSFQFGSEQKLHDILHAAIAKAKGEQS